MLACKNSLLNLGSLKNFPLQKSVTVEALESEAPLKDIQVWFALIVTATSSDSTTKLITSAIWAVSVSWVFGLAPKKLTTLESFERPRTFLFGMYAIVQPGPKVLEPS